MKQNKNVEYKKQKTSKKVVYNFHFPVDRNRPTMSIDWGAHWVSFID